MTIQNLGQLVKNGPPIERGRISRREAIASGAACVTLLPALRGEVTPVPDQSRRFEPEFLGQQALNVIEANLPKLDRNYAGYGNDGDSITIDEIQYELQLLYSSFAVYDSEIDELLLDRLVAAYVTPAALALARCYDQPDLKHIISRRLEPPRCTGVLSSFVFHDYLGLRSTIAYEAGRSPPGVSLAHRPEGRTLYVFDMLIGVKKELVNLLPCPVRMPMRSK